MCIYKLLNLYLLWNAWHDLELEKRRQWKYAKRTTGGGNKTKRLQTCTHERKQAHLRLLCFVIAQRPNVLLITMGLGNMNPHGGEGPDEWEKTTFPSPTAESTVSPSSLPPRHATDLHSAKASTTTRSRSPTVTTAAPRRGVSEFDEISDNPFDELG